MINLDRLNKYIYDYYMLLLNRFNFANWVFFSLVLSPFIVIIFCFIFGLIMELHWNLGIFFISSENALSILGTMSSIQATILSIFLAFYSVLVQINIGNDRDVRYVKNAFKDEVLLFIICIYIVSIIIDLFTMKYVNATNPTNVNLFLLLTLAVFAILVIFPGIGTLISRLTNNTIRYEVSKKSHARIDMAESDLSGLNLQNKNLSKKNLSGSNLSKTICIGTNFYKTNLQETILIGSILNGANLNDADLTRSEIDDSEFRNATFLKAKLNNTTINNTIFSGSMMRNADLSDSKITDSELDETDLTNSKFNDSNIIDTDFRKANLRRTRLTRSNFINTILEGADLSESYLVEINLSGSKLKGANLSNIRLDGNSLDQLIVADGIGETEKDIEFSEFLKSIFAKSITNEKLRVLREKFLYSRRVQEDPIRKISKENENEDSKAVEIIEGQTERIEDQFKGIEFQSGKDPYILAMFDISGSMFQEIDLAKNALINCLKQPQFEKSKIALILFGDNIRTSDFAKNDSYLYSKIRNINADEISTQLYDAFEAANDILKRKVFADKTEIYIILITDGRPSSHKGGEKAILKFVNDNLIPILRSNFEKFGFKCIRMGSNINDKFLNELENLIKY